MSTIDLQVAQPLSNQPQSVTDANGNQSGLQLAATPSAVNVTTDLTVSGELAVNSIAVTNFNVSNVSLAELKAAVAQTGELTAGTLTVTGETVSVLSGTSIQTLQPGTYTAPTDGFVLGVVNGSNTGNLWIGGVCGPLSVVASGGNVGTVPVGGSFLLPVPANNPFTLSASSTTSAIKVEFNWVPMGTGQAMSS